jgi:hypothetical protein
MSAIFRLGFDAIALPVLARDCDRPYHSEFLRSACLEQ